MKNGGHLPPEVRLIMGEVGGILVPFGETEAGIFILRSSPDHDIRLILAVIHDV